MKRKGLGKGRGMGYKNIVPRDPYIHSLSARGVKSYMPMQNMKLKAMGHSKMFKIDKDYSVTAWWENTSYGFRHIAVLYKDGRELARAKATYYNRTWEKYEFESVIHNVVSKHFPEKEVEKVMKAVDKNRGSMWAKGKKNPVNEKNSLNYIMEYEGGNPSVEDVVNLFSHLVKSGQAWTLQGMYGRQAQRFIDVGILDRKGNINWKKVPNQEEPYRGDDLDAKGKKWEWGGVNTFGQFRKAIYNRSDHKKFVTLETDVSDGEIEVEVGNKMFKHDYTGMYQIDNPKTVFRGTSKVKAMAVAKKYMKVK